MTNQTNLLVIIAGVYKSLISICVYLFSVYIREVRKQEEQRFYYRSNCLHSVNHYCVYILFSVLSSLSLSVFPFLLSADFPQSAYAFLPSSSSSLNPPSSSPNPPSIPPNQVNSDGGNSSSTNNPPNSGLGGQVGGSSGQGGFGSQAPVGGSNNGGFGSSGSGPPNGGSGGNGGGNNNNQGGLGGQAPGGGGSQGSGNQPAQATPASTSNLVFHYLPDLKIRMLAPSDWPATVHCINHTCRANFVSANNKILAQVSGDNARFPPLSDPNLEHSKKLEIEDSKGLSSLIKSIKTVLGGRYPTYILTFKAVDESGTSFNTVALVGNPDNSWWLRINFSDVNDGFMPTIRSILNSIEPLPSGINGNGQQQQPGGGGGGNSNGNNQRPGSSNNQLPEQPAIPHF